MGTDWREFTRGAYFQWDLSLNSADFFCPLEPRIRSRSLAVAAEAHDEQHLVPSGALPRKPWTNRELEHLHRQLGGRRKLQRRQRRPTGRWSYSYWHLLLVRSLRPGRSRYLHTYLFLCHLGTGHCWKQWSIIVSFRNKEVFHFSNRK